LPIIKIFWYVYKTNPVVGCMLAGVISHQPAQAWIISLTGLTEWAISLWPVVSTAKCATSHL